MGNTLPAGLAFSEAPALTAAVRAYWNEHIHDLEIASHPAGSPGFFTELEDYRFDKLRYLPERVDFAGYAGKRLLEVGCGLGTDLVRFARGGAIVTGIDLAPNAIDLAARNLSQQKLKATLKVMDGERMAFPEACFDIVYAHGVLQYTADAAQMVAEIRRVLIPGGEAILMLYNRRSWLSAMANITRVALEHADAPVLHLYTQSEMRRLLGGFTHVNIVPERFPVASRLHRGWKGFLFNRLFVPMFNALPRAWVRAFGWHLLAFATK
jgi:SAM-dependent methyltransferase